MKTSRAVFSEIQKKAGAFPFTLRALEDEKRARMGVQEAVTHGEYSSMGYSDVQDFSSHMISSRPLRAPWWPSSSSQVGS